MKKITLTIGIPAYNEAENIGALLVSLNRQRLTAAVIEKIIVYSDASSDNTLAVVNRVKNPILQVISGKKRMGKANAMNMIMKHTTSDILVILDADILIRDVRMIERLVEPILKKNADLASARVKEYWTKSKFEEILKISMLLKKDILIIHRTYLKDIDIDLALSSFGSVIVTSGGGYPHNLNQDLKFIPFSIIDRLIDTRLSKIRLIKWIQQITVKSTN